MLIKEGGNIYSWVDGELCSVYRGRFQGELGRCLVEEGSVVIWIG